MGDAAAGGEWEEGFGEDAGAEGSDDAGSLDSSGLEDESAHLYDVKTPEHYGSHLKKYAKERSKSGQMPGKIGKSRGKATGARPGKQGKNQASCKTKKQTTRSRCADRTWKNFEVSVFILGLRAEGGWSRNHSGEIHPGSSAASPTGLSTALSETVLQPPTGGATDATAAGMRPYLSAALIGQGPEEPPPLDEALSPTTRARDPRDAFLRRLKSAAETPERSVYEALLQRANRLFEELQGPEATPQAAETTWAERGEYLQRLCRWQRAREDISKELQRGDAKLSGTCCFRDAWETLRKVSHELVQLGRNCASSVGIELKRLPEMKGNEPQRAILTGIRALALLCRERDNVTFDRIYESSDAISTSIDKYTCMAAGAYDMVEGLFAGTRETLRTVLPPSRDPDLRAIDERCQVLHCVWHEVPGLMKSVSKLAEVNGPCHTQHGYVLLVSRLVEMALEALMALKASIRQLPKTVQSERDLLVHSWLPGILCSLQQ